MPSSRLASSSSFKTFTRSFPSLFAHVLISFDRSRSGQSWVEPFPWPLLLEQEDRPYPCHRSAEPRVFICFSSLFRLDVVHFFHRRVGRFPNSDVQEERWEVGLALFRGLFSLALSCNENWRRFALPCPLSAFFACWARLCCGDHCAFLIWHLPFSTTAHELMRPVVSRVS